MTVYAVRAAEEPHGTHEPDVEDVVAAFDAIAAALSAETDLDGLLHLIAERVCHVTGVSRCALYLRDTDHGLFRGKVAHPGPRRDADAWMARSVAGIEADRFTQEILATKEPVLIVNALEDPRPMRRAMLEWDIHSMLGVPMILRDEVLGLLFLDNGAVPHVFTPAAQRLAAALANLSAVAISQARRGAEMRDTLQTVVRQNRLLRQVSAMDDQLSQQVLDGASLEEIADSIVTMTTHPCGIYDAGCQQLALALADADETAVPRLMDPAVRCAPEVSAALAQLQPGQPRVIGPFPSLGLHRRHLVARVQGRGDACGYVVLVDHGRRLTTYDAMLARRAATMVALELSAERRAVDADRHARESLVRDLLHGLDEQRSLGRRAGFHQLALDVPHVVCLFHRRPSSDGSAPAVADVHAAFARVGLVERPFCAAVEAGVALLLRLPDDVHARAGIAAAKRRVEEVVAAIAPDGGVVAAVSPVCRAIPDYPRAIAECERTVQCMTSLLADESITVLATDDLGAGRLLLASTNPETAERFALDAAGALLEDSSDRVQLLATLAAFCDSNRNVRATGSILGIHENTVRYRLGKIHELTGLDVMADAEDQLTAQFAMLVFKLRGWIGGWRGALAAPAATAPAADDADPAIAVGSAGAAAPAAAPAVTTTAAVGAEVIDIATAAGTTLPVV
ncbi:GAF domain-containing protein [Conexibacter sp. CPCC 206217]|uniref:helix-turn-helix domain-containing protein n=1 Tax=Conexibacter sp. CPCC 206217 TaxID=3064574 RepID=UPI0027157491|nr:GAF domain-containing protein [Conexibacter sp. CPCC 206217]MDO8212232.1 GAF domain-containing protein [Conexibacter sp. CPCC 206217]